jgi:hypothetical protein
MSLQLSAVVSRRSSEAGRLPKAGLRVRTIFCAAYIAATVR